MAMCSSSSDWPLENTIRDEQQSWGYALRSCNPGDLGRESFYVIFLPLQNLLGNEHGEISVLDAQSFDSVIEPSCLVVNSGTIAEGIGCVLWMVSQML